MDVTPPPNSRSAYMQARRIARGQTRDVLVPTGVVGALWAAGDPAVRAILADAFDAGVLDACNMVHARTADAAGSNGTPPQAANAVGRRQQSKHHINDDPVDGLDRSEWELLAAVTRLHADGHSARATAQHLGVSERTVQRYLSQAHSIDRASPDPRATRPEQPVHNTFRATDRNRGTQ